MMRRGGGLAGGMEDAAPLAAVVAGRSGRDAAAGRGLCDAEDDRVGTGKGLPAGGSIRRRERGGRRMDSQCRGERRVTGDRRRRGQRPDRLHPSGRGHDVRPPGLSFVPGVALGAHRADGLEHVRPGVRGRRSQPFVSITRPPTRIMGARIAALVRLHARLLRGAPRRAGTEASGMSSRRRR